MASDESGEKKTPTRRGHPSRIRKKNQRFFNDDEETDYAPVRSPKKQARTTSTTSTTSNSTSIPRSTLAAQDKLSAQNIGTRLRNLLKLPKAHKWVCYEYFYSNLDEALLTGQNDFCICLKESFPQLKTKRMRRVEWCKIRRLMGKPRRCSQAFFTEERAALEDRRDKIRLLQQRKLNDLNCLKDLPDEIPLHLVIGTKVTARLRIPQDGLFTGSVEALDTVDSSYRITFDRPGLGTHSIRDFEVLSNEDADTIPISSFQQKQRARPGAFSPPRFIPAFGSPGQQLNDDPLLSSSPFRGRLMSLEGGTYGGFPIKFLVLVTRLSKILSIKKNFVEQLQDMNTQAEKLKSYQQPITVDFQKKYANVVLELEDLNNDLAEYLLGVQQFCQELTPGIEAPTQPSVVRKNSEGEAEEMVGKICQSMFLNKRTTKNEAILKLVGSLSALMLQVRTFSESDFNSFEFKSLQDSLGDIKLTLDGNNINSFQNNVEIHISHIQSGLSQMGNLHAFSSSSTVASS